MLIADQLQKFLEKKFKKDKLAKKELIEKAKIPPPTISKILSKKYRNPRLPTVLKIATYFKCSMDEVLGRKNYYPKKQEVFTIISAETAADNFRKYLQDKINKYNLNLYKLGMDLGFSENIIFDFVKNNIKQKTLGTAVMIALADYFEVSIDEMIGRVSTSPQELQTLEESEPKTE